MKHKKGFTLFEVLIAVCIIAILVALLIPAVMAARASAQKRAGVVDTEAGEVYVLPIAVLYNAGDDTVRVYDHTVDGDHYRLFMSTNGQFQVVPLPPKVGEKD